MSKELNKRVAELESETKRLGFTEVSHYSDEERATLIV